VFRFALNPRWSDLPHCSALLNGFPRDYSVHDYRTTLSIKSVVRGEAWYETASGRYRVTPDVFLVLNHDQHYSMEVDGGVPTETLCPFFQRGFMESAAARGDLDEPQASRSVEFCERLYPMDSAVGRALARMRTSDIEDGFHELAAALLEVRDDARRELLAFPAVRVTTREELYRRLYRARDFLFSSYGEPVTVSDAASIAAMSPFHFHHAFKRAFGRSPMQLLRSYRLEAAKAMIENGSDVTTACLSSGFESATTFSGLFKRTYGCSPRQVAKKAVLKRSGLSTRATL